MKTKNYRVIYSEVIHKYLAQAMVSYIGWTDEKNSKAFDRERWLKLGDWVDTLNDAKWHITCDIEFDKSQMHPNVVYEFEYEHKYEVEE